MDDNTHNTIDFEEQLSQFCHCRHQHHHNGNAIVTWPYCHCPDNWYNFPIAHSKVVNEMCFEAGQMLTERDKSAFLWTCERMGTTNALVCSREMGEMTAVLKWMICVQSMICAIFIPTPKSELEIMNMIHLLVTLIAVILNALTRIHESMPLYYGSCPFASIEYNNSSNFLSRVHCNTLLNINRSVDFVYFRFFFHWLPLSSLNSFAWYSHHNKFWSIRS